MKRAFVLLAALGLGACTHNQVPPVRTVYVDRAVAVSCVPDKLDGAPEYPDTNEALKAAPDAADRYRLMAAGRELRKARLGELEPVVAACREAAKK